MNRARAWHVLTLVVAVAALVLQTVLVFQGGRLLDDAEILPLGERLLRLVSYFTIQSNIAVAIVAAVLVANPAADGRGFRVLRLDALIGITVTGLVAWFLLRPLMNLTGVDAVTDTLLHIVVPLLAFFGWLFFGPRPRIGMSTIGLALIWPVLWLGYTLVMGEIHGWYPYPFIDVSELGYPRTLLNAAGVTVLFLALFALAALVDRKLPATPKGEPPRS
ncbi:Pr6Pr family membrane protein [Pseudactinotalea sp.]|uniref:Pr6Pr family membrane protein n=1 Tax=Pseudactinotalea sp. TaxID=1926260 RepID=UPI003B3BD582